MTKTIEDQKQRALEALMRYGGVCRVSRELGISLKTLWAWLHEEEFVNELVGMASYFQNAYDITHDKHFLLCVNHIAMVLLSMDIAYYRRDLADSQAAENAPAPPAAGQIPQPT